MWLVQHGPGKKIEGNEGGSLQVGCGSGGQTWREGWARETGRPGPTHLNGHLAGEGRTASRFPGEVGDQEFKEASSERLGDFVSFSSSKGQWEGVWQRGGM